MMAKHQISHSAGSLISYCLRTGKDESKLDKTKPRIILANLCPPMKDVMTIRAAIEGANNMRNTDRVHHIIFAHPKTDARKVAEIGEARLIQEAIDMLKEKGINLDDAPYVVIAHQDKDNHIDYHLIAASTNLKGKPIKDSYIGSRAMNATNQISKKYGLTLNNDKEKKQRKTRRERKEQSNTPASEVLEKIELAEVTKIEIDSSSIAISESCGITENLKMGADKIEEQRRIAEEEEIKRKKEEERKAAFLEKMKDYNEQCKEIGLSNKEMEDLYYGKEVVIEVGRKVKGMTNDKEVQLLRTPSSDSRKVSIGARVGGVIVSIVEWLRGLAERIKQNDTTRKQSQEEREHRRRGIKR